MTSNHILKFLLYLYIFIFFSYLFGPLIIMSITAFNSAEFPAISPWECFSLGGLWMVKLLMMANS